MLDQGLRTEGSPGLGTEGNGTYGEEVPQHVV